MWEAGSGTCAAPTQGATHVALAPGQLQRGGAGPPEEPSDALPTRVERGEAPGGVLGARSLWSLLPAQTPTFTIWERQTLSVSFPGMLQHVARDKERRGGSHCGLGDCQEALGTVHPGKRHSGGPWAPPGPLCPSDNGGASRSVTRGRNDPLSLGDLRVPSTVTARATRAGEIQPNAS